ncbi:MAG: bifunctional hydroxymethylpyrimidine kinase/phosphomethylpyrimidine kinase [Bacteroidetes bacterium]|nr:bifunctional hydroxymethylpyrimidine kinase/phosphomethylpyrimidine kinase [Bacteroidota bacterium]
MSVLVVGSVAFDAIETPFGKTDKIVGGAASYICLASSFFTKPVRLVSVVGGDFPHAFVQTLNSRGVDTQGLEVRPNEKSFFWSGRYHNDLNSRDTLDTQLNVLATFDPQIPAAYQESEFLMLGNLVPDIQRNVIRQMKRRPRLVVMDTMNFWMDTALDSVKKTIAEVDVLTINDEEARQLSGEYSLVKAARAILAMGPRYLIIKKGEHGALLFHENQVFFAPALPLEEVFDPTGAGDTFAGGFLGYLAATKDLSFQNMKNAVIYGSTLASFCVEKFGTERLESLTIEEVRSRYKQFLDLVQIDLQLV